MNILGFGKYTRNTLHFQTSLSGVVYTDCAAKALKEKNC